MAVYGSASVNGFLHAEGRKFVNGKGEEVILEGFGTGNWQNPEGFMCGSPIPLHATIAGYEQKVAKPLPWDRKRTMNQVLIDLAGEDYAHTFWPRWEKNHLGEGDIKAMSEIGLNSVRLVLNAASFLREEPGMQWIEEGFAYLDQIIDWCEQYKVYAILDLHAAPGGQSALACDAGYDTRPRMFYEKESWDRAVALWEKLARRYCKRWIVGGYELLNEPLSSPLDLDILPRLGEFYDTVIAKIRKFDKKHMFFLEGAFYSTDCSLFDHEFDPGYHNWAITFHKYGFSPEKKDLYPYLEKSVEWDVPVWLGEGGAGRDENCVFLNIAKDYGIGFNFWCWKSALHDGQARIVGHKLPKNWDKVQGYILGGGDRPAYKEAAKIFDELLENLKFENCITNFDWIRQYRREAPFEVAAVGYDNTPGSFCPHWDFGNLLNFRPEDHTKLVFDNNLPHPVLTGHLKLNARPGGPRIKNPNEDPLQALLLELSDGEHAEYTVRKAVKGTELVIEGRSAGGAEITVSCNGEELGTVKLGRSQKKMKVTAAVAIPEGCFEKIRLTVTKGTAQLKKLYFTVE